MIAFEWCKLRRSRRPWVAGLLLLLFLALMLTGFYTYAQTETRGAAEFRLTFENESYFNGLTFALYAFYFAFLLILPVLAALEGGVQIAGETGSGTLLLVLSRPYSRSRLFLAKFAVALAFAVLLTGAFLAVTLLLGLLAVGFGDLDLYPGVLQMTDHHQHLSRGQALLRFLGVWPAASLSLVAPLSLGFLFSARTRNAVNAVGAATVTYLVLYVVSEIHFFRDLRPWLFTSSMTYWRELFQQTVDVRQLLREAARLLAFSCAFLALAYRRFRTREEC